jgi:hypothetical protein
MRQGKRLPCPSQRVPDLSKSRIPVPTQEYLGPPPPAGFGFMPLEVSPPTTATRKGEAGRGVTGGRYISLRVPTPEPDLFAYSLFSKMKVEQRPYQAVGQRVSNAL